LGYSLEGKKPAATLEGFASYAVSKVVNSTTNDDPRCIEPVT